MQSFSPQLVRAHTPFLLICLPFSTLKGDLLCLDSTMGSILHCLSLIKGKMSYLLPHNSSLPFFLHQNSARLLCRPCHLALPSWFFWDDKEASGIISDSRLCYAESGRNKKKILIFISTDLPSGLVFVWLDESKDTGTGKANSNITPQYHFKSLDCPSVPHYIKQTESRSWLRPLYLTHIFL